MSSHCLVVRLSIRPSFVHLFVCLFVLFVRLSVRLVCLSVRLSVFLSVCPSGHPFMQLQLSVSVCLTDSVRPSVRLPSSNNIHLYVVRTYVRLPVSVRPYLSVVRSSFHRSVSSHSLSFQNLSNSHLPVYVLASVCVKA